MSEGDLTETDERAHAPVGAQSSAAPADDLVVLPSGTVTLLFTDIEGSTRRWELDEDVMARVVARHDELLHDVVGSCGGSVFKTVGDAFHAVFTDAAAAVVAAAMVQRRVFTEEWPLETPVRVRCALHTGVCELRDGDYFGQMVNRVARLEGVAHGGQVVMSDATHGLVVDRLPADLTCVDLGPQQLKDLSRPERVWQLSVSGLPCEFPPLVSLSNPDVLTNIAAERSSFLGRGRELEELSALLDQSRLVTIVGPGGVGKTRLASHAAVERVERIRDGVWFVDLAPLRDSQHVVGAITRAIGVRDDPAREPMAHLIDTCADREMLIVLDNCEHLIDTVATVADKMLQHCPAVSLLATSREPLRIHGEQRYQLEPMSVPDDVPARLDALGGVAAVELFCERARMQQPGFALTPENAPEVVRICRALDGIPLAIELAAARMDTMPIGALAGRIEQPFALLTAGVRSDQPRMQTLEALIDWSWALLIPPEQVVMGRLSVAPGSFTLEAGARLVARHDDQLPEDSAADCMLSLVRKSLLQALDDGRYTMLVTIRAYASRRLAEHGPDAVRVRRVAHREIYTDLAREAEPHMPGPDHAEWTARLALEHDNFVAAIDRATSDDDVRGGLLLATALYEYWGTSGHSAYAVGALQTLVDHAGDTVEPALRCRALSDLAVHEMRRGDYEAANRHSIDAVWLARDLRDDALLVRALTSSGLTEVGAIDQAMVFHDEALALARTIGDDYLLARALQARQFSQSAAGCSDESVRCLEEERAVRGRMRDAVGEALALSNLADEHLQRGDDDAARTYVTEALAILDEHASATVEAPARLNAGWAELSRGDRAAAAREFRRALEVARRAGLLSDVDYAILGLAQTAPHADDAAALHGASDALLQARDEQLQPLESVRRDADQARLRSELGDEAFGAHYERGRRLAYGDAVTLALSAGVEP